MAMWLVNCLPGRHLARTSESLCGGRSVLRIKSFLVHDECQSMGLGRLLLESVEERFSARGGGLIKLSANSYNSRAISFYMGSGYVPVDVSFPSVKLFIDDVEIVFEKKIKSKG